ncbi:MAG: hypothetical protein CFE35_14190 [Novosphingobium sp. PASSN1]|nr:MAG: hypothetical protein CFE35_14190 [Novosphingobium sp. PASSN1]
MPSSTLSRLATISVSSSRSRVSAYKVPKTVHLVSELPLTQYGKIDKRRIRAQLIEEARSLRG